MMRERLIELIREAKRNMQGVRTNCDLHRDMLFADYLLEQGVIVPPCKVGDTLYVISQMKDKRILPFINKYTATSISIKKKSIVVYHEMDGYIKVFKHTDFGKTVFLTREEAERALKERAFYCDDTGNNVFLSRKDADSAMKEDESND